MKFFEYQKSASRIWVVTVACEKTLRLLTASFGQKWRESMTHPACGGGLPKTNFLNLLCFRFLTPSEIFLLVNFFITT